MRSGILALGITVKGAKLSVGIDLTALGLVSNVDVMLLLNVAVFEVVLVG